MMTTGPKKTELFDEEKKMYRGFDCRQQGADDDVLCCVGYGWG